MYLSSTDKEESSPNTRVKSVFCFAVSPDMRGHGVAEVLLKKACEDATEEGFDYVEAYPNREFMNTEADCMGPAKLFEKMGFTTCYEIGPKLVMRKKLI